MQVYFHSLLWSYLPRVPTLLTTRACVCVVKLVKNEHSHWFVRAVLRLWLWRVCEWLSWSVWDTQCIGRAAVLDSPSVPKAASASERFTSQSDHWPHRPDVCMNPDHWNTDCCPAVILIPEKRISCLLLKRKDQKCFCFFSKQCQRKTIFGGC